MKQVRKQATSPSSHDFQTSTCNNKKTPKPASAALLQAKPLLTTDNRSNPTITAP
jgi:hypothetical protein